MPMQYVFSFKTAQQEKRKKSLPWKSTLFDPHLAIFTQTTATAFQKLFSFRNIKLILKNFTKASWTSTFGKTIILIKPDPNAWWENRGNCPDRPQTFGILYLSLEFGLYSTNICSEMLLTLNRTAKMNKTAHWDLIYLLTELLSMNDRTAWIPQMETPGWKPPGGNPRVETPGWKPPGGNPRMETPEWKPPFSECMAITTASLLARFIYTESDFCYMHL